MIHLPFQRFGIEVEGIQQGNGFPGLPEVHFRDGRTVPQRQIVLEQPLLQIGQRDDGDALVDEL
ncbi:hypothetical protein GY15_03475 [Delftia sp. 670]|nr:hypothetical protein GY15_03475 [Delftia sp. 670]